MLTYKLGLGWLCLNHEKFIFKIQMSPSGHSEVTRIKFFLLLETAESSGQNTQNNGLQDTGHQITKDSES